MVARGCTVGRARARGGESPTGVMSVATDHLTATGDEAGTPPGDRKFRPDVQGMRAIAILLALVYHAGVPGFSGGYVGIEVFFVISGFVITGLLLREREGTGRTSLRSFYGRRARRIIPAATLVIIVTVIVSYHSLGPLVGHQTAVDGQWAAVVSRQCPLRGRPHQLPRCPGASLAPSELLVPGRRGTVLHRLSDALPAHRMVDAEGLVQDSTHGGPRRRDRRLVHVLHRVHVGEFTGRVLLVADAVLGTGAGRAR